MTKQKEHANTFKSLHIKGNPVILFNVWDAGSAKIVQEIGAKAIATGSWSVAAAHGFQDGEKLPFELALANLNRIISNVDLPVTFDFEGGYGTSPAELQVSIAKVIEAGAVGINFEDQIVGGTDLYSIQNQGERIQAIRKTADRLSVPLFINARTDIFLKADSAPHNESQLEEALSRASAYADSGATGFFVPGLINIAFIETLCERSPLPINIMYQPDAPSSKQLAEVGVSRISYGPYPYLQAMNTLKEAGSAALSLA